MLKKKLVKIVVTTVIVASIAGCYSVKERMVHANTQLFAEQSVTGKEEISLLVTQKAGSNELGVALKVNDEFKKSITSFELALQFDSSTIQTITTTFHKQFKSSQCRAVYNKKTGILKLYVVGKQSILQNGTVEIGKLTVDSNKDTTITSGVTLDECRIVDLNHKRHTLIVDRETKTFECVKKPQAKPTVTPTPTVVPKPTPIVVPTPTPVTVVKVEKIQLNKTKATIAVGSKTTLKASILPANVTNKTVKWTTSNQSVATVSKSGVVTGKKKGTATIKATSTDGSKVYAKATITVKEVKVKSISLSTSKVTLLPKETKTLKAKFTPSNTTNQSLKYKSSNAKVATVSKSGKITAKGAGTATIMVISASDPGVIELCNVTVTELAVSKSTVTLSKGKTDKLTVRVYGIDKKVTYQSSNPRIAAVSKSGKITAKAKGTTTITVKSKKKTKKVKVVVK